MGKQPVDLELYFKHFRKHIIGQRQHYKNFGGERGLLYADWAAGGRLYWPIEETMLHKVAPWVTNTHNLASAIGTTMTRAYQKATQKIKEHVNANADDILISCDIGIAEGMTKFQSILELRIPDRLRVFTQLPLAACPVVFMSHMEQYGTYTSWSETICKTVIIPNDKDGRIDLHQLKLLLRQFPDRTKIVSVAACSHLTGIETPYHKIAGLAHEHGAVCFVDFTYSAPYSDMDMHPNDTEYLDAIIFSPHKFLGGPGSCGVLVLNKNLIPNKIPDIPEESTHTLNDHPYKIHLEDSEDAVTPRFLQTIRVALAIKLKEEMGTEYMKTRGRQINKLVFRRLYKVKKLQILAEKNQERIPFFSFNIDGLHQHIVAHLLNDKFGIHVGNSYSCTGVYNQYLMNIGKKDSVRIPKESERDHTLERTGWVRVSLHPTVTDWEIAQICHAIRSIAANGQEWKKEYVKTYYGYRPKQTDSKASIDIDEWFEGCCSPKMELHFT
ncbi:MAG: aminotransferase class V-fold PLP-dependent enzyme [Saonia sp.]